LQLFVFMLAEIWRHCCILVALINPDTNRSQKLTFSQTSTIMIFFLVFRSPSTCYSTSESSIVNLSILKIRCWYFCVPITRACATSKMGRKCLSKLMEVFCREFGNLVIALPVWSTLDYSFLPGLGVSTESFEILNGHKITQSSFIGNHKQLHSCLNLDFLVFLGTFRWETPFLDSCTFAPKGLLSSISPQRTLRANALNLLDLEELWRSKLRVLKVTFITRI